MQSIYKKPNRHSRGYARKNDLERVFFSVVETRNPNIDNKTNILLSCFVSLAKLGYDGVAAPIYHILKMLNRSGYRTSERSLYRALSSLQDENIISRQKYRLGDDRFCTIVTFNKDVFTYWTRNRSENVTPITTCNTEEHIDSQLPNWQEADLTKSTDRVNTSNYNNKYTKQRAGARDQYIQTRGGVAKDPPPKGSRKRRNALLRSILICLDKMSSVHRSDRKRALSRARSEIYGKDAGVEFVNPTGIDWQYWSDRWSEFSIPVRESTAMREIIPALLGRSSEQEQVIEVTEQTTVQRSEVEKIERFLRKNVTAEKEKDSTVEKVAEKSEKSSLKDSDLAILMAAKEKVRSRVV